VNYDETAKKILSDWDNYCFKLLDGDTPAFDIQEAIAAALRRAANEAAYRGFDIGAQLEQGESWDDCDAEMASEYGPRPEGGTR
jgi:hypothetical protein